MTRRFLRWLAEPVHLACVLGSSLPLLLMLTYFQTYTRQVPGAEQWNPSLKMVIAYENGTFGTDELFNLYNGHRTVWNHLLTIGVAAISGWNVQLENAINPLLACLNFLLYAYLAWKLYPHLLHWLLIPISLLVFAIYQDINWLIGFLATWHLVPFFLLSALAVMLRSRPGGWPLLGMILLTQAAALAFASGLVNWLALIPALWLYGYRQPGYWLLWGSATTASLLWHFTSLPASNEPLATLADTGHVIRFSLILLGSPFTPASQNGAIGMTLLALLALGINLVYLRPLPLRPAAVGLALLSATFGTALLIAITRVHHIGGLQVALEGRYTTSALPLWLVLIVTMLLNFSAASRPRWLIYGNLGLLLLLGWLYMQKNLITIQNAALAYDHPYQAEPEGLYPEEACVLNFPLSGGDLSCLRGNSSLIAERDYLYQLAAYRLSIFHDRQPVNLLPETYQAGSPVVLDVGNGWLDIYIRDQLLAGIDVETLIHVLSAGEAALVSQHPQPPVQVIEPGQADFLNTLSATHHAIWYITTPEKAEADPVIQNLLSQAGYVATPYPIQHPAYRLAQLSIYRFQRPPDELATVISFGEENIRLQHWTLNAPARIQPCENLYLQSWWQSAAVPQLNYSTSLVLVAPDGNFIAQKDAAIGDTLMQLWQPDQLYFDERILTLPCDLPPGTYRLTLTLYHHRSETNTFEHLPAFDPAGEPLGERPVLTTLEVGNP